ncbi:MAG: Asp-tRNA(Asn)/Glu-tRNA(Gln) amidotransferase subunit GatA [Anaerolineales bacterium]|nr:Asp-tRNA(Asn)/Glu-tRNA(Gln) amidotransferase subunit GatA [Anaerolineales bacterium]
MSAPVVDLPAYEQARRIRDGELTAVGLLQATLKRTEAVEGQQPSSRPYALDAADLEKVHAFINRTEARALQRAEAIDAALAAGEPTGPLAGVPLAVKDNFCVQGTATTAGSKILENFISPYAATAVERLEQAGAVVVGKVNLDEFTFGSSNESSAFLPPVGNPWNPAHVPGGSSGGSTAAVAAGEASLSLGSDTAGSIRQPAAFCGVVGMKPTYGRVSRYGLIAFASSLDCVGPVARNITDTALMMNVIAGPDRRDATAANLAVPDYLAQLDSDLEGMRIGLSPDYFWLKIFDPTTGVLEEQPISPEIEKAVLEAAELLAGRGATIVEDVPMPNTHMGIPVYFVISRVEAASNLHRYDGVKYGFRYGEDTGDLTELYRKSRGAGFGLQPKLRILMGMYVSAEQYEKGYYERALQARTLIRQDFERAFDPEGQYGLDCLLTATTPTTAFKIGAVYGDSVLMQYADMLTVAANHAGVPGISIPAGLDRGGLPIGIQLLGPDFSESRLLQIGRAYERATEDASWRSIRPIVVRNLP